MMMLRKLYWTEQSSDAYRTELELTKVPEKDVPQLSSEQFVGDVWIAQLDQKRVPQVRSSSCKCSVSITAKYSWHHASRNVSWPQKAQSAVRHEAAVICQGEAPARTATGEPDMRLELDMLSDSQWNLRSSCIMWSRHHVSLISRAVAFCTDCNLCSRVSGKP